MRFVLALFMIFLCGCESIFFKATDGTDLELAVSMPNEDSLKFQILHYLSGETVKVKEPSEIIYKFKHSETNSYFGIIETRNFRESEIKVYPATTNKIEKVEE